MDKIHKTFNVSETGQTLIRELADKWGVTQSAVVEIAVREKARREGILTSLGGLDIIKSTAPTHVESRGGGKGEKHE